jgi:hypothetical protein
MHVVLKLVLDSAFSYKYINKYYATDLIDYLSKNDIVVELYGKEYCSSELLEGIEVISDPEAINAFILLHGEQLHSDIDLIQLVLDEYKILVDEDDILEVFFHYRSGEISYFFTNELYASSIELPKNRKNDNKSGLYITTRKNDNKPGLFTTTGNNNKLFAVEMTEEQYENQEDTNIIEMYLSWKELWDQYYINGINRLIYE